MTGFLIISDTHAYVSSATSGTPSFLEVTHTARPNMIGSLAELMANEDLKPEWIVCPGDLGDRASPEGQAFVWRELNSLKNAIGATHLVGAAGNHDLDSRFANSGFDPLQNIKSLRPLFPGRTQAECDQYWARHYVIYEQADYRIVNLNSSAFHGYGKVDDKNGKEFEFGRVSEQTIDALKSDLAKADFRYNILLTHHHIVSNQHIYAEEYSEMRGGGRLMHRLSEATRSSWFVIHGHLHFPEIDYGRGASIAPVVFSAGSASARSSGGASASPPNQVYFLELADSSDNLDGWSPCGTIRSWYWSPEGVWAPSPATHKIPDGTGFGTRLNAKQAADRFENALTASGEPYVYFQEAFDADPLLRYLLPGDLDLAVFELRKRSFKVTFGVQRADSILRKA
ncbi:metallophosphoesterase family protein [Mesorhizobium sp. LSJC265A00]|uniref:metallophosphoesterase family protein n=1 Tax=Mesorhizobium sp. LSJC265A00 TaxID=1287322 RepID=UPI0009FBE5D7|nr:metallophosphoesterase [Mesorhizobium sp. LSJC265A00]